MKRLDLYIFKECLPTFTLSLVIFSFALMIQKFAEMFDLVVAKGVPVGEVVKLLFLAYPALLSMVLPVSLLLAVLLAMGRLSSDSEVVVMRACGVSLGQNLRPVLLLSALVMGICLVITLWLGPLGRREFKLAAIDTVVGRLNVSAEAGAFTELSPGVWLYADKIDENTNRMEGMFIHTEVGKLAGTVVTASEGSISAGESGLELTLKGAEFHQARADGGYTRTRAETSRIILPVRTASGEAEELTVREFSTPELYRMAFTEKSWRAEMEFYRRFTVPLSCLMLGILGCALGSHHFRSAQGRGLVMCLVVLFLNYALFTLGDTLARRHALPVWAAMALPDLGLGILCAYAVSVKNRERELTFERALASGTEKLRALFSRSGEAA